MNARKTLKAEILITRKCQLACCYCQMPKKREECTLDQWKVGLDNLKALGCGFLSIYGAEPTLVFDKLCGFINYATKLGIAKTVITNAVDLTPAKLDTLIESGLDSLTVSFDSKGGLGFDKSVDQKSKSGLKMIGYAHQQGKFRDLEVIMTLHRKNYKTLPEVIRWLTAKGIWVAWDVIHWGRWFDSKCSEIKFTDGLRFEPSDKEDFQKVMTEVLGLVREGGLVFNTEDTIIDCIEKFDMVTGLHWVCSYPGWVTIDCDGRMRICDDKPGTEAGKYFIWDLTLEKWDEYLTAWKIDAAKCLGCYWSTHVMSERMYFKDTSEDFFAHRIPKFEEA